MESNELLHMAQEAKTLAYAPYSDFPVGAALSCADGAVFFGANVENASSSLGLCAERVAIVKAVTAGRTRFEEIAVNSDSGQLTFPCGACLQMMAEFSPDLSLKVTVSNKDLDYMTFTLQELLPFAFQLNKGNQK